MSVVIRNLITDHLIDVTKKHASVTKAVRELGLTGMSVPTELDAIQKRLKDLRVLFAGMLRLLEVSFETGKWSDYLADLRSIILFFQNINQSELVSNLKSVRHELSVWVHNEMNKPISTISASVNFSRFSPDASSPRNRPKNR